MGIHQVKSALKTYYSKQNTKDPDDYLQKSFSSECLQLSEFLENFWDSAATENFDWTNIQENKKPEEGVKEKERYNIKEKFLIPELPLNQVIIDNLFSIESIFLLIQQYRSLKKHIIHLKQRDSQTHL